jgi:hypothetical protein
VTAPAKYGLAHQKLREQVGRQVATGTVMCARCGLPIDPLEDHWDLDHADDGNGYLGASHSSCNRAAGAASGWERIPDPDPGNVALRWSRHWYGQANPRCPDCRERGGPCAASADRRS